MNNDTIEQWKDIPGYEGLYRASKDGHIESCRLQRLMKLSSTNGYQSVHLSASGNDILFLVHRLVMLTFVGLCPEGLAVNHKNGIRHDNRLENLEYVTYSENTLHAIHILKSITYENMSRGVRHHRAKLDDGKVREIRALYETGRVTFSTLAQKYNVSLSLVAAIVRRKIWKHIE